MSDAGVASRRLAIAAMTRIDTEGAYANLLLPTLLADTELNTRDRAFVTELVYGATRMRRAVDHLTEGHIERTDVDVATRAALRIGAYQLHYLRTAAHAAVDATVAATPKRSRGFVNAILRRVATADVHWPTEAVRLSYPDWIVNRLECDLGDRAHPVLEAMNRSPTVHTRPDGYRQDPSSAEVAALITAEPGDVVVDMCAAPGGKATTLAHTGAAVVAVDLHPHRAGLLLQAATTTGTELSVVVADGRNPPLRSSHASAVLIDAPCSGLGALRRRPDARWRIKPEDLIELADLQYSLVREAAGLVAPGGQLVFSVCTLTNAESVAVDERVANSNPALTPTPLSAPWEPWGRGGRLLPDTYDGDGMMAIRYRKGPA